MPEEEAKKEESKSEDKKESDLAQFQEEARQAASLFKPLWSDILELIKSIPFIGASAAGGISFWAQQKLVTAFIYFVFVFFLCNFFWPLYKSASRSLRGHSDQWGGPLVDNLIALFKRELREIYWRYSGKERKFLEIQGFYYANDDPEGLNLGLSPLLKDIFVPLELSTTTASKVPELLTENFDKSGNSPSPKAKITRDGLQIWTLLKLGKTDPTYRRLLIKAKGGLGKTTLLRHIVYTYSQTKWRWGIPKLWRRGIPKLLPILIRLRDWDHRLIPDANHTELKDLPIPNLANLIQCYIEANPNLKKLKFSDTWAKEKLENGKMLILWDGFDEVKQEWQGAVSEWLGKQMQDDPQSYFILTSRPHWYNESYSEKAVRPNAELYVKEFNPEQIEKFINNWYLVHFRHEDKIRGTHYPQDYLQGISAQKTQNLIKQLQERPELRKLAEIPLNLNMIVNLHSRSQHDTLPRRRAELYQEIMNLQLIERPGRRDIDMILQKSDRQKVLQHLALWMGKQGRKQVEKTDIDNISRQFIVGNLQYSAQTNVLEFIEKVVRVSELLVKVDREYEFSHHHLQSYLSACEIIDTNQENLLLANWQKTEWEDTILMYASLANATQFITSLLGFKQQAARDLAYECFKCLKAANRRIDSSLEEQIQKATNFELTGDDMNSITVNITNANVIRSLDWLIKHSLYQQLENYLINAQWKEADIETARVMLQIVGKEADQWLSVEDIQNFPCEELRTIDKLWIDYSEGKFGFSVQKKVWIDCGGIPGKYDDDVYKKIADQVGWRRSGDWLSYDELTFSLDGSEKAHLPFGGLGGSCGGLMFLFSRNDL